MISPEFAAAEREAAERIIRLCRDVLDEHAQDLLTAPQVQEARSQAAKSIELRYAILAVIEAAIADRLRPVEALTRRGDADVLTPEQSFTREQAIAIAARVLAGDPRTNTAHASLRILAAAVAISCDGEWREAEQIDPAYAEEVVR